MVPGVGDLDRFRQLNVNGELGTNFQGIMALAVVTTIPVALVFLAAQRQVMQGMTEGAVKG